MWRRHWASYDLIQSIGSASWAAHRTSSARPEAPHAAEVLLLAARVVSRVPKPVRASTKETPGLSASLRRFALPCLRCQ